MQIDDFKCRTFNQLDSKQESQRTYAIGPADLTYVEECPLCDSDQITLLTEVYLAGELSFHSTSICNDCLCAFRSVSPSLDWFKKCWSTIATGELEVFNPEVEVVRRRRYEEYNALLFKYVRTGRLLDVGAAYGTGTKVFQDLGYQVDSLEPDDDKANYVRNFLDIPVFSGSLDEFPQPPEGPYDLVLFAHCLEHLDNPKSAIAKIRDLVKPDSGILYIEVPVLWNFVTWSDALYLAHKSNFTEENIHSLLADYGFEVLETTWFYHASPDEPWHLGLVARPAAGADYIGPVTPVLGSHTIDEAKKLYRKDLPLEHIPEIEKVIRYSVPHIEQFYSTLRLDSQTLVAPGDDLEYITIEPEVKQA